MFRPLAQQYRYLYIYACLEIFLGIHVHLRDKYKLFLKCLSVGSKEYTKELNV